MSNLPADELIPDSLKFTLGGMRVEYSDATINRAIKKVNPVPSARVTVHVQPEQTVIAGSTGSQHVDFSIRGNFEVTPDQKKIVFLPDSITVNGDTMEGHMLQIILDSSDLTWDITRYYPKLSVTGVSYGSGRIAFSLRY